MADRQFVTAVDPQEPLKGNRTVFVLDVYYDWDGDMDTFDSMNETARDIGGGHEAGAGFGAGVRDMEFHFATEEDRASAKLKFQDAGFRFYCHEECLKGQGHHE